MQFTNLALVLSALTSLTTSSVLPRAANIETASTPATMKIKSLCANLAPDIDLEGACASAAAPPSGFVALACPYQDYVQPNCPWAAVAATLCKKSRCEVCYSENTSCLAVSCAIVLVGLMGRLWGLVLLGKLSFPEWEVVES